MKSTIAKHPQSKEPFHRLSSEPTATYLSKPISNANFWAAYESICAIKNLTPLSFLKTSLLNSAGAKLVIDAERIKSSDWEPLCAALSVNKHLESIKIIGKHDISELESKVKLIKHPPNRDRNKDRSNKICRSLKDCLGVNKSLNEIEIYDIPLNTKDCVQLGKGLRSSKSIRHLTLNGCQIGDEGLIAITQEIKFTSNLIHLDLTSCQLTSISAQTLCDLIESQAFKRHAEAWKDSLRYGKPDLDNLFGLRRLTLNRNRSLGDKGAERFAESLKNDLWLKALDLQECGITNQGASVLLKKLKGINTRLYILDLRSNPAVEKQTVKNLIEMTMENGEKNGSNEFEWLELNETNNRKNKLTEERKPLSSRNTSTPRTSALGKAQDSRNTRMVNNNDSRMKRSKSASSIVTSKSTEPSFSSRTSARDFRAQQYGYRSYETARKPQRSAQANFLREPKIRKPLTSYGYVGESSTMGKNVSVNRLILHLRHEQEVRSKLEDQLIKLQEENMHLKSEIDMLRFHSDDRTSSLKSGLLNDEKALDVIELTLNKYKKFLDFLRTSGYGKLIDFGDQINSTPNVSFASSPSKKTTIAPMMSASSKKAARSSEFLAVVDSEDMLSPRKSSTSKSTKKKKAINNDELVEFNIKNRAFLTATDQIDGQNYNIDNLLSNALEISRSYRKLNVSSSKSKQSGGEKDEEAASVSQSVGSSSRKSKPGTQASSSPATTVIMNEKQQQQQQSQQQQPPPVTARSSRSSSKKSDASQVVEDLSQILSDEDDNSNDEDDADADDDDK